MTTPQPSLTEQDLLLSIQRALWGQVHASLRQVSADIDTATRTVLLRFEYDDSAGAASHDACRIVSTEVLADLPDGWTLDDEHVARPSIAPLERHRLLAFLRAESGDGRPCP